MTSKVLVKLPVVPFQQRKKPPPELVPLPSRNEESDEGRFQGQNVDKVTQLEQNMKFLQEQHQITLVALHQEVEILRQRNRDLQFQLVFSKGTNYTSSSPSSPEDTQIGFAKQKQGSPTNVNVAPLQVELLEKDLQDLKASLNEAKARNTQLTEIIEKQKQKLELYEKSKEKQKDIGIQVDTMLDCQQVEMQARLDDAEALVKRLRLENDEQRREISNFKSANSYNNGNRGCSSRGYHNRGPSNDVHQGQDESYQKFPPLQTQSYWHRGSRGNSGITNTELFKFNYRKHSHGGHHQDYSRNARHPQHQQQQQQQQTPENVDGTVLPQLQNGSAVRSADETTCSYPPYFRSQNQHSYHKDDQQQQQQQQQNYRRYRGKKQQRDFACQDRVFHKNNQRQQQQTEYSETPKGTRSRNNRQ